MDAMTNMLSTVCLSTCLLLIGVCGDEMVPLQLSKRQTPPTCTGGYETVEASTMCLTDSPAYIQGSGVVSDADKQLIIQLHNEFRAAVRPTARGMPKIYWDNELARVAGKWARQCVLKHERHLGKSRFIPAYGMNPGQNGGQGHRDWDTQIKSWHNEKRFFRYGQDYRTYLKPNELIGHYTQVVQEASVLVGCGYAKCKTYAENYYFCDYLDAQSNMVKPYAKGRPCSGCPKNDKCTAETKLCDCGGKFCFNDGKLDLNTCQCACSSDFEGDTCLTPACGGKKCQNGGQLADKVQCDCKCSKLNVGANCETKQCPDKDPQWCARNWKKEQCEWAIFLKTDCPNMCGIYC